MTEYIYEELADMHLTDGETKENGREARRLYDQRFPTRHIKVILCSPTWIDDWEKSDCFHLKQQYRTIANVRMPKMEEQVLSRIAEAPSTCTRAHAYEMVWYDGMVRSQKVAWRILHEKRTNYVQKVAMQIPDDYPPSPLRTDFLQWVFGMRNNDPRFPALVLVFRDEAKYSREDIFNLPY